MKNSAGLLVLAACIQIYAVSVAGDAATASGAATATGSGNGDGGAAAAVGASAAAGGGSAAADASAAAAGSGNRNGQGTSAATGASAAAGGGSAAASASAAAAGADDNGGAAAAVAVAVATGTDTSSGYYIPCNCGRNYNPVCATNGKTYANICILNTIAAYNYHNNLKPIAFHRPGECPRNTCNCVKLYRPVCGSDGQTYANICYLKCEQSRCNLLGLDKRVEFRYRGVCQRSVCQCTDAYIPVCGSDNLTYRNVCILNCVSCYHQSQGRDDICVKHAGPCTNECCSCTREYAPICASDGKTYNNKCLLCCENRRRHHLGLEPLIACKNGPCCENCKCEPVYDPVCASDGDGHDVTFANSCLLNCENKRRRSQCPELPALTICSWGVCPCKCNYIYDPVCASDGRTYSNVCVFRCENKRCFDLGLRPLEIVSKGPCQCCCKHCTLNYQPVCGCDGRTYTNICWLECNRRCSNPCRRLYKLCNGPCPCC